MSLELHIYLCSDASSGRGDGVAGLVDSEVVHDATTGLPYLRGRTIKGLLVEACADVLYALRVVNPGAYSVAEEAAASLFGRPGGAMNGWSAHWGVPVRHILPSSRPGGAMNGQARVRVGPATLPQPLIDAVRADVRAERLAPYQILDALTGIRRQTAIDPSTGAPDAHTLRSVRVVLRETELVAQLSLDAELDDPSKGLLAACVLALRGLGSSRNRGRGEVRAWLVESDSASSGHGSDVSEAYFAHFATILG